jgi:hypothetical protein
MIVKSSFVDSSLEGLIENAVASHTDEIAALMGGDHLQQPQADLFVPLSDLFTGARIDPELFSH